MNKLFLTAITGECCLFYMHKIKPQGYNPFVLLRNTLEKEGVKLPVNQLENLKYLHQLYVDNNFKPHRLLEKALVYKTEKV